MARATTEVPSSCLKTLFLDRAKDTEYREPITIQILCSGYDIVTGGWGDKMISRVTDGAHWALAALDAKKFSATELHNQYKLMTPGTILKVKGYEIRHYKHGKLCLLMRDFAFLERADGFSKPIRGSENLVSISHYGNASKLPDADAAPIRLPSVPFLYGESKSIQALAPGIPVLDANLMGNDPPRSPRTKIPNSPDSDDVKGPPELARKGEFYPDVWGLTCIEYLNLFKCLKSSPALALSLGDISNRESNRPGGTVMETLLGKDEHTNKGVKTSPPEGKTPPTSSPDFFPTANNRIHQQCLARAAIAKGKGKAGSNNIGESPEAVEAKVLSTEERNALFFEKLKARLEACIEKGTGVLGIDMSMGAQRHKRGYKGEYRNPFLSCQQEDALMLGKWRSPLRSAESGFNQSRLLWCPYSTGSDHHAHSGHAMGKENYHNSFQLGTAAAQTPASFTPHFAHSAPSRHTRAHTQNWERRFDQSYDVHANSQEWQNDEIPVTPGAQCNPVVSFPQGILVVNAVADLTPINTMPHLSVHYCPIKMVDPTGSLVNENQPARNYGMELAWRPSSYELLGLTGDLFRDAAAAEF